MKNNNHHSPPWWLRQRESVANKHRWLQEFFRPANYLLYYYYIAYDTVISRVWRRRTKAIHVVWLLLCFVFYYLEMLHENAFTEKIMCFLLNFSRRPTSPPSANNYDSYSDLKFNGQSHRPAGFLSGTNGYFNPYLQKHGFYGPINPKDRVSIGGGKWLILPLMKH